MISQRYLRQVTLPELGAVGQQKLASASVLMVGAGGLGCAALQYLCSMGIGTIGIVDDDVVQLSNLHRQVLYSPTDIGKKKAIVAAEKLRSQNPDCIIVPFVGKLDGSNADELISAYNIVIDGSDNLTTRYCIDSASRKYNKPWIYAGIEKFVAQIAVFNYNGSISFEEIFPEGNGGLILDCNETGILGHIPGIIGLLQVNECVKIITGSGEILSNATLCVDLLNMQFRKISFQTLRP